MLTMIVKAAPLLATILWRWLGLESLIHVQEAVVQGVEDIRIGETLTGSQSRLGMRFLTLGEPL
jgi:hypothetical protein